MSLAQTTSALDSVAFIVVVLSVLLVVTRSLNRMVWLVALLAIVVSLVPLLIGLALDEAHLIVAAALSVAIRGVAIPLALGSIVHRSNVRVELHPYLGPRASATLAIIIVLLAAPAAQSLTTSSPVASTQLLAAAIAVTSIGLLLIITRRKTLSAVIGLLVFDTGLSLAAFGLSFGMPLVVELGVLFDLLIAVAVIVAISRRMLSDIGSLSSDNLRNLRG